MRKHTEQSGRVGGEPTLQMSTPFRRALSGPMSRRAWLGTATGTIVVLVGGASLLEASQAGQAGEITVYKSPTCGCCEKWVGHLRHAGLKVTLENVSDVTPIKRTHGVPASLYSCHTGLVSGYVIEGHVPPDLISRLLHERPAVAGLAVPGMPAGSPGMESDRPERYEVLAFTRRGEVTVFAVR